MKHRRSIIALVLAGLALVALGAGEFLAEPEQARAQAASEPCVIDITMEGLSATGDCPGTITVDTDGAAYFQGERTITTQGEGSCTLAYESVTGDAFVMVLWANPGYALKPAAGTDCPTGTQVRFHGGLDPESVVVDTVGVDDPGFPANHPFGTEG